MDGAAQSGERRHALAAGVIRLLRRTIADPGALLLCLDDDEVGVPVFGTPPRATVRVRGPDAVARMLWPPTPETLAEGYLRGDLEIEGDMRAAVDAGGALDPGRLAASDVRRLIRYGLELRRGSPPDPGLRRRARLAGPRHSPARDMAAIRFHYDVGEAFFSIWLDRRMAYSCAYFERADDPATDLDAAQEAKLDLICRKLGLRQGVRLLDIGCGWGSLILFAAERYGVEAIGITLSERQASEANRRAAAAGLGNRVRAEVRDYRDLVALGQFEAIASVGMFEHVGRANLNSYFAAAYRSLVPGGRFLNHGIADAGPGQDRRPRLPTRPSFVERFVFPDGELVPIEDAIAGARGATGFEVIDVQSLRPHYALTLAAWVARLERGWEQAVTAAGEEVARTWRLYMSAARLGFERGNLDVLQLLLGRPDGTGAPAPRPIRPWW